jgi:Polyketide cyclase / dehydrase and lipid transport
MMKTASYHFITNWQVEATCEEVYNTLKGTDDLARWWPSVYLDVAVREKGDKDGLGKVVELYTKGWLPYTLVWQFRVTDIDPATHSGFALEALGDFVGRGVWTFEQEGIMCNISYDWKIEATKPILKYLSFIMKPLFSANHLWAMRKGLESLKLELKRRRGEVVPLPPQPTFPHNFLNNKILRKKQIDVERVTPSVF